MSIQFRYVFTDKNKLTNVCFVRNVGSYKSVLTRKKRFFVYGMCSHGSFPKGHDVVASECSGWAHGFRDPDVFIPKQIPKLLLSSSDFTNPNLFFPSTKRNGLSFCYCIRRDLARNKNFNLFLRCLSVLSKHKLTCYIIGTTPDIQISGNTNTLKIVRLGWLSRNQVRSVLSSSSFLFVPNVLDSSPRIVTEAMCCNTPVVMNENILGGWKYINKHTGTFFTSEQDVEQAVHRIFTGTWSPRQWFSNHYGPEKSGKRLYDWVQSITPKATKAEYYKLCPLGWVPKLK